MEPITLVLVVRFFCVYVRSVAVNVRAFNGFNRIELEHFLDVIVVVVRACESIARHFV